MQWLGGIGIVVMAITILPLLKVGGMQLFKMEGPTVQKKFYSYDRSGDYNNFHLYSSYFSLWFFLLVFRYDYF